MLSKYIKHIFVLLMAAVVLSGCYRDPIASMHKKMDKLNLNSVEEQISQMKQSVEELKALQRTAEPMVESLKASATDIQEQIEQLRSTLDPQSKDADSVRVKVIVLQDQYDKLKATVDALENMNLAKRIQEIEDFAASAIASSDASAVALEAMEIAYATMDEIAPLRAAIELLPSQYETACVEYLENSVESIAEWVTKDPEFCELVDKYFTAAELDRRVAELEQLNAVQDSEILVWKGKYDSLMTAFPEALANAIKGLTENLDPQIEGINSTLDTMVPLANELVSRVEHIEEIAAVIGDYSNYKSNLIADILALQAIVGDEGTLTSLVNTMKLVLSNGEEGYYKIHEAVADLYENTDSLAGHDKRVAALEKLSKELAKAEDLQKLIEQTATLGENIAKNKNNIAELVRRVDDFVDVWTQTLFAEYEQNIQDIIDLKTEDEKLWLVLGSSEEGAETGIYKTLADINVAIVNFNIGSLRENVNKINDLLANCGIDGVTGLQNCLENIDGRIKAILDTITDGNETLSIGMNLIEAVNKLYAIFGEMPKDSTIIMLVDALNADINIIKGEGWSEGVNLASLDKLSKDLRNIMDAKDTKANVNEIVEKVKVIQGTLLTLMTTESFNDTLNYYLTVSDADKTYALAYDLEQYITSFNELFGLGETPAAANTVLGRLSKLETAVGDGVFTDGWIGTLTDAVNTLHTLVGSTSAASQAQAISEGIVDDLVKQVLGLEGNDSHETVAQEINTFASEIAAFKDFSVDMGEDGKFEGHTSMDDAVAKIYSVLSGYATDHDIDGTFGKLCERFQAIENAVGAEFFTYGYSIKDAYTNLVNLLGPLGTGENSAKSLLDNLGKQYDDLIKALLGNSGTPADVTADLSLTKLKERIDQLGFSNATGEFNGRKVTIAQALTQLNAKVDSLNTILGVGSGNYNLTDSLAILKDVIGDFSYGEYTTTVSAIQGELDQMLSILSRGTDKYSDITNIKDSIDVLYALCQEIGFNSATLRSSVLDEMEAKITDLANLVGTQGDMGTVCDEIRKLKDGTVGSALELGVDYFFNMLELRKFVEENLKKPLGEDWIEYFLGFLPIGGGSEVKLKFDATDLVNAVNIVLDKANGVIENQVTRTDLESLRAYLMGGTATPYGTIVMLNDAVLALQELLSTAPVDWYKDSEGNPIDLYSGIAKMDEAFKALCMEFFGTETVDESKGSIWTAIEELKVMALGSVGALINSMNFIPEYTDGMATLNSVNNNTVFSALIMDFHVNASARFPERYAQEKDIVGHLRVKESGKTTTREIDIKGKGIFADEKFTATFPSDQFSSDIIPNDAVTVYVSVGLIEAEQEQYRTSYIPVKVGHGSFRRIKAADPASGTEIIFAKNVAGSKTITLTPEISGDNLKDIDGIVSNTKSFLSENATEDCKKIIRAKGGEDLDGSGTVTYTDGVNSIVYNVKRVDAWNPEYYTVTGATVSGNTIEVSNGADVTITIDLNKLNTTGKVEHDLEKTGLFETEWIANFKCNLRSDNVIEITFHRSSRYGQTRSLKVSVDGINLISITLK